MAFAVSDRAMTAREPAGPGMRERGIIMSGASVRAILAGSKTQTRRVLKPQPERPAMCAGTWLDLAAEEFRGSMDGEKSIVRFEIGDTLWVKEAIGRRPASFLGIETQNGVESAFYKADDEDVLEPTGFNVCPWWRGPTLSPIHTPRWASRLTLTVTDVRVQQLQEISEEDAVAEGVEPPETERDARDRSICPDCGGTGLHGALGQHLGYVEVDCSSCRTHRDRYRHLWNSLHGPGAWDLNPWIAALTFTAEHAGARHG